MKSFLLAALIVASNLVKADQLDDKISALSKNISTKIYSTGNRFSAEEKKQMITKLNDLAYVLEKNVCANEPAEYQKTFDQVEKLASRGFESNEEAAQYAKEWTKKYPCSYLPRFTDNFVRIRSFANRATMLNIYDVGAIQYALKNTPNFCEDYVVEVEYKNYFDLGVAFRGLNYSLDKAKAFARKEIEKRAFNCSAY